MPVRTSQHLFVLLLSTCLLVCLTPLTAAQTKPTPAADSHLVPPPVLAKLVPTLEGWTRSEIRMTEVDDVACAYTQVTVWYTKDGIRVKLMFADTGAHADSIMALASPIAILPENYAETLQPATTIKRLKIEGSPASEMWNAEKMSGEITLLVGGRFAVVIETAKGDGLDMLRTVLAAMDLKAIAALK